MKLESFFAMIIRRRIETSIAMKLVFWNSVSTTCTSMKVLWKIEFVRMRTERDDTLEMP